MEEQKSSNEPIVFTQEMMVQLINQLNAVTTYFDLLSVQINKLNERISKLENKKK